jgi:hypothetical protein
MERLKVDYGISCQSIATKYGFTRQHIGELFKQLNGITYSNYRKVKTKKNATENIECKFDPRQKLINSYGRGVGIAKMQIKFMEKCQHLGFDVKVSSTPFVNLYVNGHAIKIPVLITQRKHAITAFTINTEKLDLIDFYAPYLGNYNAFFIIPKSAIEISGPKLYQAIYIRNHVSEYHNAKNKYMEYMNDFGQLKAENLKDD